MTNTPQATFIEEVTQFVDVIVPVSVPNLFTYRLMREQVDKVQVGARVIVQFGRSKVVTAVVQRIHEQPPKQYSAKYVLEILDEIPYFKPIHLETFRWIADYYMCHIGEVLNVALPAGLKVSSLSKIQVNPDFDYDELLTDREKELLDEIIKHQALTYDELARFADVKNPYHIIKNLIAKKAILVYEELHDRYSPKILRKIRLNKSYEDATNLKVLLQDLEYAKKQAQVAVLLKYLSYVPVLHKPELNTKGLEKSLLAKDEGLSASTINTLIKNGIFEDFQVKVSRFDDSPAQKEMPQLSMAQQAAYLEILEKFQQQNTVLLYGVTSSGKTEVYIKLIEQALEAGSQVLYLLPEIALTTQIVQRLRMVFGEKVGVYHSKFTDNERVEVWQGMLEGKYNFIVGVRSAIFLPFDNLGLIIVDEEHESSYKQYDPAPRYHARDVALVIAQKHRAKVLLGSATPAIESMYQAQEGKYGLVQLTTRYSDIKLPNIQLVDLKRATQQKNVKGEYALEILQAVEENLRQGKQTILFQNRRGFSPYIVCMDCNWTALCYQCDVSLTYHYKEAQLRCHYCGHHEQMPRTCPSCGGGKLQTKGFGTEKVEDDMVLFFPTAKIARIDMDTTRNKGAFQSLIAEVESGAVDILVGTQMISKGLDFDHVNLVCIFDADRLIHYPDFRSRERAYQLLSQVAGRAGRRHKQGEVLIQTQNIDNELLRQVVTQDYEAMYHFEIAERQKFLYPPFGRLIQITLKHQDQNHCYLAAHKLYTALEAQLGKSRVLGPDKPVVERIRDRFLFEILVKLEKTASPKKVKEFLTEQIIDLGAGKEFKQVQVIVDVDFVG